MLTTRRTLLGALTILVGLMLSMMIGTAAAQSSGECPAGQGYWKNTPTWPVTDLVLGGQSYSQVELIIILNTPVEGDASLNLAHQLIAAKLNAAQGGASVADGLVMQADALLATYSGKLPFNIDPSGDSGQTMVNIAGVLDSYNSGLLTVGCTPTATPTPSPEATSEATPQLTPEATSEATPEATSEPDDDGGITIVIEGPVQSININIITIYNINIQLDEDDPNLKIIQIGDIVRIEGDSLEDNGTIIIVAVTVVIINVDINVGTGEVWRDEGDCLNGPPPWAPAHGWRRRCEQNNNSQGDSKHGNKHDDDD
ncbi:MAG: hypothetical protein R3E39_22990 [Anaerolineae bacterium]